MPPILDFPSVETANNSGLVAIGGDITVDSLMLAYSRGIYPWPIDKDFPLAWFSPNPRGVILLDQVIIDRSLRKFLRKCDYKISFNQNFNQIIKLCQQTHSTDVSGTWITDEIVEGYTLFHNQGFAYSIEVRNLEDEIIGGLYGVHIGHYISGESMFHTKSNASKVALAVLLYNLKSIGIALYDTQMITSTTMKFGARNMRRKKFIEVLQSNFSKEKIDFSKFETNLLAMKW